MEKKLFTVNVDGEDKEVFLRNPTHSDSIKIDLQYRKMFAEAVRAGLLTNAESRKVYEKNKTWREEDEKQLQNYITRIAILESIITQSEKDEEEYNSEDTKEAVEKLQDLRMKSLELNARKMEMSANTAEGFAEEQKIHKFIELCLIDSDTNGKMFENEKEYARFLEKNPDAGSEILKRAYFYEYGDPNEITKEWAEMKFAKAQEDRKEKEDRQKEEGKEKEENNKETATKKITTKKKGRKKTKKTTKK